MEKRNGIATLAKWSKRETERSCCSVHPNLSLSHTRTHTQTHKHTLLFAHFFEEGHTPQKSLSWNIREKHTIDNTSAKDLIHIKNKIEVAKQLKCYNK
jgi:hypothetical protein